MAVKIMMKNNGQAGYTTTLSPTFLLKSLRQFSDKFFQRMILTQVCDLHLYLAVKSYLVSFIVASCATP